MIKSYRMDCSESILYSTEGAEWLSIPFSGTSGRRLAKPMHKEAYFSPGEIQAVSREMLATLMPIREQHSGQKFDIQKACLLILDMQKYFLEPDSHAYVPSGPAIIPGILQLMRVFEGKQRPVILTRHLNSNGEARMMRRWWRDLIQEESTLSNLVAELHRPGSRVILKEQYDAFFETSLDGLLHEAGVEQVLVCGVMTHLCCESTARSAFMRGYEVFVTIDGMATYNRAFHQAALLNLAHGFAIPLLVEEIIGRGSEGEDAG